MGRARGGTRAREHHQESCPGCMIRSVHTDEGASFGAEGGFGHKGTCNVCVLHGCFCALFFSLPFLCLLLQRAAWSGFLTCNVLPVWPCFGGQPRRQALLPRHPGDETRWRGHRLKTRTNGGFLRRALGLSEPPAPKYATLPPVANGWGCCHASSGGDRGRGREEHKEAPRAAFFLTRHLYMYII